VILWGTYLAGHFWLGLRVADHNWQVIWGNWGDKAMYLIRLTQPCPQESRGPGKGQHSRDLLKPCEPKPVSRSALSQGRDRCSSQQEKPQHQGTAAGKKKSLPAMQFTAVLKFFWCYRTFMNLMKSIGCLSRKHMSNLLVGSGTQYTPCGPSRDSLGFFIK
jgi:hypothetical protein